LRESTLNSQSSITSLHNTQGDLESKKNLISKCAKCISISHIKKLADLFNISKANLKVAKIFAMAINSFREQRDKLKFETIDKNSGLSNFFSRNPS
jgi:hypothetical protein